ncbi:hypothetical protein HDU76_008100, partial [Blyttiomyces sp. JEL0837]
VSSSASTWTFSTRYPRQSKKKSGGYGGKGKGKSGGSGGGRFGGEGKFGFEQQPSRLRLANPKVVRGNDNAREWGNFNGNRKSNVGGSGGAFGGRRKTPSPSSSTTTPVKKRYIDPEIELLRKIRAEEKQKQIAAHESKFEMLSLDKSKEMVSTQKQLIDNARFEKMGLREEVVDAVRMFVVNEAGYEVPRPVDVDGGSEEKDNEVDGGKRAVVIGSGHPSVRFRPTPVQALAIPASLDAGREGRALVIGAETGSGKTLAYLVPMINRLKQQEVDEEEKLRMGEGVDVIEAVVDRISNVEGEQGQGSNQAHSLALSASKLRRLRRPRAVIFVPSRELVHQVTNVAKKLCSHHARLTVLGLALHGRPKSTKRLSDRLATTPIDILVTTPKALSKYLQDNLLSISKVTEIVVDEADTMLDEGSFESELDDVLIPIWESAQNQNYTTPPLISYVSATMPMTMVKRLQKVHENYIAVTTPSLHRTLPRLQQFFLRVTAASPKRNLVLEVLKRSADAGDRRVIVFCNRRVGAEWVFEWLRGKGIRCFLLTAETDEREREDIVKKFSGRIVKKHGGRDDGETLDNDGSGNGDDDQSLVLVATDVASRGVDTSATDHVILYDFPLTAIDYLHRVGRTARNGGKGRATSLVEKKDLKLAEAIQIA